MGIKLMRLFLQKKKRKRKGKERAKRAGKKEGLRRKRGEGIEGMMKKKGEWDWQCSHQTKSESSPTQSEAKKNLLHVHNLLLHFLFSVSLSGRGREI